MERAQNQSTQKLFCFRSFAWTLFPTDSEAWISWSCGISSKSSFLLICLAFSMQGQILPQGDGGPGRHKKWYMKFNIKTVKNASVFHLLTKPNPRHFMIGAITSWENPSKTLSKIIWNYASVDWRPTRFMNNLVNDALTRQPDVDRCELVRLQSRQN